MRLLPSPKSSATQIVTRHLGGLSAIQDPKFQAVIWARKLTAPLREELAGVEVMRPGRFVCLPDDPLERVQQQLRLAGLKSHFLAFDMALLVTVFGELAGARRIMAHIRMGDDGEAAGGIASGGLRLVAAYEKGISGRAKRRLGSYVAVIREEWFEDHPLAQAGGARLHLCLEAADGASADAGSRGGR